MIFEDHYGLKAIVLRRTRTCACIRKPRMGRKDVLSDVTLIKPWRAVRSSEQNHNLL